MKYTDENRFTQDERDAMDGLARVVAFVCGVDYDKIKSKTRKRKIVDARKIACKYAYDNIPNTMFLGGRNLALPSWYFGLDHGTVHHSIDKADELYEADPMFAKLYDAVIDIVDNPKYEPDFTYDKLYAKKITWDSVRMDMNQYNKTRYAFMPQYVREDIVNMFERGYGELTIANKVGTTMSFVEYFIKREGLKKDKMAKIRKAISSQSVKFGYSKSIAY
jgi:hypothetical protein